jgi:hypothetical protein
VLREPILASIRDRELSGGVSFQGHHRFTHVQQNP